MAVLYLGGASALSFSCRRCAKLKYDSQRSGLRLRLMRKAQKLRRQLGGSGSLWKPFPDDGVVIARRTVVVALGILADGRKVVLGLWQGSTENAALCTALLQNLLERGLKVDGRTLCVIDGGRGIRKALEDVFGDLAVLRGA